MKIGTNSFIWMDESLYNPFDCIRLYNDMDFCQNERGLYTFAPTKKNTDFNYDTVLGNLTAQGKSAMITTHKKAQWLGTGKFESKPLETGANPEDPLSYTIFSQHLYQQQARWGKTIQPLENIKTYTGLFYGVYRNEPLTGLGYNISQMPLNETNADWWTDAEYWTGKQLAAVWSAAWDGHGGQIPLGGIMNADPQAFIVFPSLAYGTRKGLTIRQYVDEFIQEFWILRPDLIGEYPFHAIGINFYCRFGNKGIDPFDSVLYEEFTWWKKEYGLPIYLTEFGYDEIKPSKQCPDNYPNMDILATKNEMFRRGILLAKAAGVDEFYQYMIRDTAPADAGLYRTCGLVSTQQTGYVKKSSYYFFERYIPEFAALQSVQKVGARSLKIDGTTFTFNTNGTTTEGQIQPMLTIQNNRLHKDGQPFFIREANSPETILRTPWNEFKAIVDYWASVGMNTIYATLMAGDKYKSTLHPFVNIAAPSQGFDHAVTLDWRTKLEYAVSKGFILHLLLSEKENHYSLSETDHKAFIDKMVETFGHLPIIWDREELDENKADYINLYYGYLKSKHPQGIRAIHNNTNENPWRGFENSDLIQFLSFQEWEGNFDSRIKTEVPKGSWAGYSSEVTGGFQPTDTAKAAKIRDAGGNLSSGAGVYIPALDQDATLAQLKTYDAVYKTISSQVVTPPNPTTMKIGFSRKADRTDFREFVEGESIAAGNIYIEARDVTPTVYFTLIKDDVVIVNNKPENGAPYDAHGGQPYNATNGAYIVMVRDKNNINAKSVTFTVGTVTPPPTKESVTETWIENGKVFFKTAQGTYFNNVTKQ